jgi:predicted DCC family thiol-disulfide oxidoreductase YuxK
VDFCAYQQLGDRWPEIPRAAFAEAVQLIELDGRILGGADAVFRVLEFSDEPSWLIRMLRRIPGFMPLARAAYRFVAAHRSWFLWTA